MIWINETPCSSEDCVYLPELSPLLLSTLDAMEGPLTVLWANEVRGVEEARCLASKRDPAWQSTGTTGRCFAFSFDSLEPLQLQHCSEASN